MSSFFCQCDAFCLHVRDCGFLCCTLGIIVWENGKWLIWMSNSCEHKGPCDISLSEHRPLCHSAVQSAQMSTICWCQRRTTAVDGLAGSLQFHNAQLTPTPSKAKEAQVNIQEGGNTCGWLGPLQLHPNGARHPLVGDPMTDPEHTGEIIYPIYNQEIFWKSWKTLLRRGTSQLDQFSFLSIQLNITDKTFVSRGCTTYNNDLLSLVSWVTLKSGGNRSSSERHISGNALRELRLSDELIGKLNGKSCSDFIKSELSTWTLWTSQSPHVYRDLWTWRLWNDLREFIQPWHKL